MTNRIRCCASGVIVAVILAGCSASPSTTNETRVQQENAPTVAVRATQGQSAFSHSTNKKSQQSADAPSQVAIPGISQAPNRDEIEAAAQLVTPEPGALVQWTKDRKPTEAEYKASMEQARQCMIRRGFDVDELFKYPNGNTWAFGVNYKPGTSQKVKDEGFASYVLCTARYSDAISQAYHDPGHLTGAERDSDMQALLTCLKDAGFDDPGLKASETDSRRFVTIIWSAKYSQDQQNQGMDCFNSHLAVWPPGDANNP